MVGLWRWTFDLGLSPCFSPRIESLAFGHSDGDSSVVNLRVRVAIWLGDDMALRDWSWWHRSKVDASSGGLIGNRCQKGRARGMICYCLPFEVS